MDKRIYALSLSSRPMELLAGYKDGTLHVIDCKPLPQNLEALKKSLPKSMAKHKKKGFVVLVDEVIPVFAKYGRSCRLGQAGADGRPVLITALEAYRNMSRLQAISFPPGKSGFFDISESVVEEQRDAGGRVTYHIDWAELRPEATLLLMAVYGAVADSMLDTGTIKHLFNLIGGNKKESESTQAFKSVTVGYDQAFLGAPTPPNDGLLFLGDTGMVKVKRV